MDIYNVIKRPLLTEKSGRVRTEGNYYTFEVEKTATKELIKEAVEALFKVHVIKVNTVTMPGKIKRFGKSVSEAKRVKKAIVKLKKDEKIEILEGV
jgi:large subunit ribosomal protein L23